MGAMRNWQAQGVNRKAFLRRERGAGEFFAEVEIRDDLLAVDEYMMRVQVHPTPLNPPASPDVSRSSERNGGQRGGGPKRRFRERRLRRIFRC